MTFFSQVGLSFSYATPIVWQNNTGGKVIDTLNDQVDEYSHVIAARGGFQSATIVLKGNPKIVDDWYSNGVGRHISVYSESQQLVWQGFVNSVSIKLGSLAATRGPLTGIANNVALVYSTVDTTTSPPTLGGRTKTAYQTNIASQSLYGIWEKVLSSGGVTAADAAAIVASYLAEQKNPDLVETLNLGSSPVEPSIILECLGYVHWLESYTFNASSTGTQSPDQKLIAVLNASPNLVFSADHGAITTANSLLVPIYESGDHTGLEVVKGIAALGDASGNRYDYGIYADRKMVYNLAPTVTEYNHRLYDNSQRIDDAGGNMVFPYNVRPGKWAFLSDFLSGSVNMTTPLVDDPRAIYIETVTYRAPDIVTLVGSRFASLPQKLAQLGLAGIGGS
jgi:hypothetical protein